mmetsp:Transcript_31124/g.73990  ORF Transcript_31124/g.73990 Transcript_31124/m.73990 type:complete len:428 (-) Transcript_31124:193-1476(-)
MFALTLGSIKCLTERLCSEAGGRATSFGRGSTSYKAHYIRRNIFLPKFQPKAGHLQTPFHNNNSYCTPGAPRRKADAVRAHAGSGKDHSADSSQIQLLFRFLDSQFLLVGLLTAIAAAALFPAPGTACSNAGLARICTFCIFVLSGLALKQGDVRDALSSPGALAFGAATILGLTALAAPLCLFLPIEPEGLRVGLAVFCCMPTTLSSGIALTQAVGANTALALLLTVVTNCAAVFVMPFTLLAALGSAVALSPGPLLASILQTVTAPLMIGIAARRFVPGAAAFADANKRALSKLQSAFLISVPWMQVSKSAAALSAIGLQTLAAVAAAGLLLHVGFLAFNAAAVRLLRIGGSGDARKATAIRRAVVLVGSQKTLPVAVTVLTSMGGVLGADAGIAVIPCIASHMMQIVADSALVSHWLRRPPKPL